MPDYENISGGWRFSDGIVITRIDYNRVLSSVFGGDKRMIRAMKKNHEHEILCQLHSEIKEMIQIYQEKHKLHLVKE